MADAEGGIQQAFAQFVDQDGEAIGNPNQGAPTFGFSWATSTSSTRSSSSDGERPVGPDQVVMDQKTADDERLRGRRHRRGPHPASAREFTISGIARFGTADSPAGATVALFDLPTAQEFLAEPGQVRRHLRRWPRTA